MQCFIFAATYEGSTYLGSLDAPDWETARRTALDMTADFFDICLNGLAAGHLEEQHLSGFAISTLEGLAA